MGFTEKYATEEACREKLLVLRWPEGFVCPRCGCREYYRVTRRELFHCKDCWYQVSLTAGTILEKTHLPLKKWFWAIYLIAEDKRGISAKALQRHLHVTYKTAWYLLQRIRQAMQDREEKRVLQGIIELDEAYFGGEKKEGKGGRRGRGTTKEKVLVAISKTKDGKPSCLKMRVVPNLKGKTVSNFVRESIEPGALVQTDWLTVYRKPLKEEYIHEYELFDPDKDMLTWLHTILSNAKAFVQGTFHGLDGKHLQRYLSEFCYRFNHRHTHKGVFDHVLSSVESISKRITNVS